ncbi:MAG: alpha/beta fold hydrolase [Betaproteobacteria bacterium]|nr:MAG: alpha/beta fold hydrolase [Betaproteobacteria bacterium]
MIENSSIERITANGVALNVRTSKSAGLPPLLLLHGHPQTNVIWHKVWTPLAQHFSLIAPDLRGYGDSEKPPSDASMNHAPYSKREMAKDMVALMATLGFPTFRVLAHDRGARVTHRMMMDHPDAVSRATLLDIAPTLAMYEQTTMDFAKAYWHWFFLIQREPLPETMIAADPTFFIEKMMGNRHAGLSAFSPAALAEYRRCITLPGIAHAICEDYRAAATIDLEHDRADRDAGRKLAQPLQVLWGADGIIEKCFKPLDEWQRVATDVRGGSIPCGHYIPEEAPEALLAAALPFLI